MEGEFQKFGWEEMRLRGVMDLPEIFIMFFFLFFWRF